MCQCTIIIYRHYKYIRYPSTTPIEIQHVIETQERLFH